MKNLLQEAYFKKRLNTVESYLKNYLDFEPAFISEQAAFNLNAGGKRLRPAFVLLVSDYYGCFNTDVVRTAAIMELIHMSSLIHDDINDDADLRRGKRTIHAVYGNDVAVHVGDFILIKALRHVYDGPHTKRVLSLIVDTAVEMAKGEIAQIRSMFDAGQTEETYNYRIERKTALLIAICCQIGAVLGGASAEEEQIFYDYGYHLGMAFQIKDDLMDLLDSDQDVGKPTGKDLENGLVNLPSIYLLAKDFPERADAIARIEGHFPGGQTDIHFIADLIRREGCIEESEAAIFRHIHAAKSALDRLEQKPIVDLMRKGADYIYERAF